MGHTRRENKTEQERLILSFDHAAVTADTTIKLWKPQRKFRIDRVEYNNPTGLAEDPTNFFTVKILNAAAIAFSHSTETTVGDGTLAADTPVDLQAGADIDRVVDADAQISLFLDEDGTATLPAGVYTLEGRYVK